MAAESQLAKTLDVLFLARNCISADARIRPQHAAAIYALVSFREQDGTIKPSVAQLGRAIGLSAKQTRRVMHEVASLGYVATDGHNSKSGRLEPNRYRLLLPPAGVLPPTGVLPPMGVATPARGSDYSHPREGLLPPVGASEDSLSDSGEDLSEENDRHGVAADTTGGADAPPVQSSLVLKAPEPKAKVDPIGEVWAHYVACWKREIGTGTEPKLTDERRKQIRKRLAEKYSPKDLRRAIDGLFANPFNLGENANGKKYIGFELVFRSGGQVEKYLANAPEERAPFPPLPPEDEDEPLLPPEEQDEVTRMFEPELPRPLVAKASPPVVADVPMSEDEWNRRRRQSHLKTLRDPSMSKAECADYAKRFNIDLATIDQQVGT